MLSHQPLNSTNELERVFEGVPVEIIVDNFMMHGKYQGEVDEKGAGQEQRSWIEI